MIKIKKLIESISISMLPDDFTADILDRMAYLSEDSIIDICKKTNSFKNWIIYLVLAICLKKDTLVAKIKAELLKQTTPDYCKQMISQILSDKKIINKISILLNNLLKTGLASTILTFNNGQVIVLSDTIITETLISTILQNNGLTRQDLKQVVIGNSVTSIGKGAFGDCDGLKDITIPDSVTSIGDLAFYYCSGLRSIIIPDSVTSIGWGAFSCCPRLTSITIPNSVTSIGERAFCGCSGLTNITIPDSVTSIGEGAFSWCSGLTSITIPDSVTSIGNYAFSGCRSLTNINFNGTKSQWSAITKGFDWNYYVPATVVHCIDGDVNI